jgi:hypothetical protein
VTSYRIFALRLAAVAALTVTVSACSQPAALPHPLREHEFPLARVDGQTVRGSQPFRPTAGSKPARLECQDLMADGSLSINRDGRTFTLRSEWRDCGGNLLVSETNEGSIVARDGKLALTIEGTEGAATFKGEYSDSTLTLYDLGGRLEFERSRPATRSVAAQHPEVPRSPAAPREDAAP